MSAPTDDNGPATEDLLRELAATRERLQDAEYLLESIRAGRADALVIQGTGGEEVFTLKSLNLMLDSIIEQSLGPTVLVDGGGRIVRADPEARELCQADLVGRAFEEALPLQLIGTAGGTAEAAREFRIGEIIAGATVHGGEVSYVSPDGTSYSLLLAAKPLAPHGTHFRGALVNLQDITPLKKAEVKALVRNKQLKFHFELTENTAEALFLADAAGRVVFLNPAAEALFGWSLAELSGRDLHQALHPEHAGDPAASAGCPLGQALGNGPRVGFREDVFSDVSGRRIEVRFSKAPALEEGGKSGFVLSVGDVTQRNETENALRLSEEKLRQSQKMEAVGRLAGGIAHDFNNLLTAINGYSSLSLASLSGDNPVHGYLSEILKAGERAASLTNQLLAYSRKQILAFQVADVNGLVEDTMSILRRTMGEQISYELDLEAGPCPAKVDPAQLQQALINLGINARDAMPEGGRLSIRTRIAAVERTDRTGLQGEMAREAAEIGPGRYARITVEDTGHGMDAEVKSHLFEPFFTTKGLGKGTGLGLSMVYGIIRQFNGHIQVFSEPERGTTVHVYLPLVAAAGKVPDSGAARPEDSRGSETVLLVEDEAAVLKLMRQVLASRGYRVLPAQDGTEALAIASAHPGAIDILVTDMVMNGMGGHELARNLRRSRPETRMMFISGYTEDFEQRIGLQEDGIVFLQKPFSPELLARTVRETLDRRRKELSPE